MLKRAFFILVVTGGMVFAAPSQEALATIVVYNTNHPESKALAEYYASRREIPAANLIELKCPLDEAIPREFYDNTIAKPLREALFKKGFWKNPDEVGRPRESSVRFIALMQGIPLQIRPAPKSAKVDPNAPMSAPEAASESTQEPTPVPSLSKNNLPSPLSLRNPNGASVDSELVLLGSFGSSDVPDMSDSPVRGARRNPYFGRSESVMNLRALPDYFVVGRLDAPDAITVRAMIDAAISAERDGLWGWAVVDMRGISSGGYAIGDRWLQKAATDMRMRGIPVMSDNTAPVLPAGFPLDDVAFYYGWYGPTGNFSGALAESGFRFRPGAIAVHIHSFSASTLRSSARGWVGPLLKHGAAASLGNVYEPYLSMTHDLGMFQERLMMGFTFAESAAMSINVVSWMGVAVGDPLYRPFAWEKSPAAVTSTLSSWSLYRRIVISSEGSVTAAASELEAAAQKEKNPMFLEALAYAQFDTGDTTAVQKTLADAQKIAANPRRDLRFAWLDFSRTLAAGDRDRANAIRLDTAKLPQSEMLVSAMSRLLTPATPKPTPKAVD